MDTHPVTLGASPRARSVCWTFLTGHDEKRLLAELDTANGPAPGADAA